MSSSGHALSFDPLHPTFGARVHGVDLKADLAASTLQALQEAFGEPEVRARAA